MKNDLLTESNNLSVEKDEDYYLEITYEAVKNRLPLFDTLRNALAQFMQYYPVYFRGNTYQSLKLKGLDLLNDDKKNLHYLFFIIRKSSGQYYLNMWSSMLSSRRSIRGWKYILDGKFSALMKDINQEVEVELK